ncbi:MAG: hypothetical protein M0C28_01645 [Candidatus Moduliflexus flocculans]|nr:hypothetical protein [Candidatus Moduliflexus flocculans]
MPKIFKFILTYVTPVYLLVLLGVWTYQDAIAQVPDEGRGVGPPALPLGRPGHDRRPRPAHVPAHSQGLE